MSLLRIKQADGSWSNIPAIKGADGVDGKDGAVQYTAGRYIHIDENTNTINCTVKIGDLVIIDAVPVKDSTNVVSSGGVYDALEAKADRTEIAGLGSEAGFITSSVEDLKNYYKKSETYSQDEVNSLIGNLTRLTLEVVQTLPEVGTEHIIYLVPNNKSGSNVYEEWIFVQAKWEMIGTTEVDLSNYYTKSEIDALMNSNSNDSEFVIINLTTSITDLAGDVNSNSYYTKKKIFTLNETDRLAITEFLNKYWDGKDGAPTKELILRSGGRFFPLTYTGRSISSSSIGANYKSQTIVPQDSSKQMYAFTISFNVSGSAGSFTPYYSSSLSYWGTSVIFITDYLNTENTKPYTPTAEYHPATKKYVDEAVANASAGGGDDIDLSNVLTKDNTEEFTPDGDYEPATKKYVDDAIAGVGGSEGQTDQVFKIFSNDVVIGYDNSNSELCAKLGEILGKLYAIRNNYTAGAQIIWIDAKDYINVVFRSKPGSFGTFYGLCYYPKVSDTVEETLELKPTYSSTEVDGVKVFTVTKFRISKITVKRTATDPTESYQIATKNYVDNAVANAGGETPDLTAYAKLTEVLSKTNTTEYTPSSAYHPATKQYVDQTVASAGGITTESDPTVPLHVKNITQDMIDGWNNKLEAEALTEAINTAITGKDLITFSDSLQTPIITGHYCATFMNISGSSGLGYGSSFEDYDLGGITVELLNDQLKQALERIALAGNTLDSEMIYNGEVELNKYLKIKVPLRCRLMLKDTVKLTLNNVDGYADINGVESPFTHPVLVDYWTNISNTGASEWLYLEYRGPHPDGPYTMTTCSCRIPFYNGNGLCIGYITMDLKVTYTSDTDIVITGIRSASFSGGGSTKYNSYEGESRVLSTYYNDMYMTLQEDSSTSTYSLPSLYYNLNKLLLKEDESMIDFRDIVGTIPVVKRSTSTYNGKDVTDYDAVVYQIESIRRCNDPVFDSAAESGILAAGTNGTYDTVIKFADRVKVTSSYSSYSIINVNRAWLFVNYADIVSSNSEGLYAYRTSYESYKVNKETT